ncbi:hypothetical protein C0991_001050, partial [Blastosporella zonata]
MVQVTNNEVPICFLIFHRSHLHQIADILPSKTVPSTSAAITRPITRKSAPSKKRARVTIEEIEDENGSRHETQANEPLENAPAATSTTAVSALTKRENKKRNPIYHFYEEVEEDSF